MKIDRSKVNPYEFHFLKKTVSESPDHIGINFILLKNIFEF